MAGLWETWNDPQGNVVPSCTIITTAANDFLAPIHNRMPVILPRESEESVAGARGWKMPLRLPASSHPIRTSAWTRMRSRRLVNYARNDGPEVIARVV